MKHSPVLTPNKEYNMKQQCHDANISTNQALWPNHVSADIGAHSDTVLQFLVFYLSNNDVSVLA